MFLCGRVDRRWLNVYRTEIRVCCDRNMYKCLTKKDSPQPEHLCRPIQSFPQVLHFKEKVKMALYIYSGKCKQCEQVNIFPLSAIKAHSWADIDTDIQSFLTSALDGDDWLTSGSGRFTLLLGHWSPWISVRVGLGARFFALAIRIPLVKRTKFIEASCWW